MRSTSAHSLLSIDFQVKSTARVHPSRPGSIRGTSITDSGDAKRVALLHCAVYMYDIDHPADG